MIAMGMTTMNEERKTWGDWSKELYGQEPLRDIGSNREMMTKAQFMETVRGQTFTIEPDERNEVDKLNSTVRHLHQKVIDEQDKNADLNRRIGKAIKEGEEHYRFLNRDSTNCCVCVACRMMRELIR